MSDTADLNIDQYRKLVAVRYLNASEAIWNGLESRRRSQRFPFPRYAEKFYRIPATWHMVSGFDRAMTS
jgi:hypothetical protein